jgi:Ca-activated chloride channel family protein
MTAAKQTLSSAFAALAVAWSVPALADQDAHERPTFRAAVERVTVAAIVRTRNGRPVTDLTRADFEVRDTGQPRAIIDFRAEPSPVSLAILADYSGSMDIAVKREAAREITLHLLSWMTAGKDEVGLFAFDRYVEELHPILPAPGDVLSRLDALKPYGKTSVFDAIAETSAVVAAKGRIRRAVVVLTDGDDNASRLTPAEVTQAASAIDVPVYIVLVVSPLDVAGRSTTRDAEFAAALRGPLGDLARLTGGEIFAATGPSQTSQAARQIVSELRQQYWIAFEPDSRPGWHPIDIRTRDRDLVVRARSGYIVGGRP